MSKKRRTHNHSPESPLHRWLADPPGWLAPALIIVIGAVAYSNTFQSSFHFDDETSIVNNPAIRNLGDLKAVFGYSETRFVTYLTFALNYRFGGLEVFGYHLFNILVHIAASVMVWLLVRQVSRTPALRESAFTKSTQFISLLAALLFVVHPIQSQAVTYLTQRTASLAALFYISSVYLYGSARLSQLSGASRWRTALRFSAAFFMSVVGLFTKETVLTLPIAILLYELFFFREIRKVRWLYVLAVAVVFGAIPTILVLKGLVTLHVEGALPGWQYILTQPKVWMLYVRLFLFPVNQNLDYEIVPSNSLFELTTLGSLMFLGLMLYAAGRLFSNHRVLSFGILWFFLTLLPESSILPLPDVAFEHRLYLPFAGFALLSAGTISALTERWTRGAVLAMTSGIVVILGVATFERNKVWQDEVALWTDVIKKSPGKARGYLNLGRAYSDLGRYESANVYFGRAQALDPTSADVHGNRAYILIQTNQFDAAIAECNRALELGGGLEYQIARIYFSRGTAYLLKNRLDSANGDFNTALAYDANHETAYFNRALVSSRLGDAAKAIDDYSRVLKLNPRGAKALNNRGVIFRESGRLNEALADFDNAIASQRDFAAAYLNRGMVKSLRGQLDSAIEDFTFFINLSPNNFDGFYNRGIVRLRKKEFEKAIADFDQAIVYNPAYGPAFVERARAFIAMQRLASAESDLSRAQSLGVHVEPALLAASKKGRR